MIMEIHIIDHMNLIGNKIPTAEDKKNMEEMHKFLHDFVKENNIKPLLNFHKMTKTEAIQAMKEGKKVTHYHFTPEEWTTMEDGMVVLEDGVRCEPAEFWRWKTAPDFDNDWSIYTE